MAAFLNEARLPVQYGPEAQAVVTRIKLVPDTALSALEAIARRSISIKPEPRNGRQHPAPYTPEFAIVGHTVQSCGRLQQRRPY